MKLKVTLVVDDVVPERDIGIKEAIAMDMEKYGSVQVTQVETWTPEQLVMSEMAPMRPAAGLTAPDNGQTSMGNTAVRAERKIAASMACCLNCASYIKKYGYDESGAPYWGRCRESGKWVYNLRDWCRSHNAGG